MWNNKEMLWWNFHFIISWNFFNLKVTASNQCAGTVLCNMVNRVSVLFLTSVRWYVYFKIHVFLRILHNVALYNNFGIQCGQQK